MSFKPRYSVQLEEQITYSLTVEAETEAQAGRVAEELFTSAEDPFGSFRGQVLSREAVAVAVALPNAPLSADQALEEDGRAAEMTALLRRSYEAMAQGAAQLPEDGPMRTLLGQIAAVIGSDQLPALSPPAGQPEALDDDLSNVVKSALDGASGAIDGLLGQVGQMSRMFNDSDGTIAQAVEDAEEVMEQISLARDRLKGVPGPQVAESLAEFSSPSPGQ